MQNTIVNVALITAAVVRHETAIDGSELTA